MMIPNEKRRVENHQNTRGFYGRLIDFCSPSNIDTEDRARRTLPGIVGILSCPVLFGDAFYNLWAGHFILAGLLFLVGVIILASVLVGRRKKDAKAFYRLTVVAIGILFLYLMGMIEVYPHHMFWSFVFPSASLYLLGKTEGLFYTVVYYFCIVFLVLNQNFGMLPNGYEFRFKLEYFFALFIVGLMAYCFEFIRCRYQETTKRRQASLEVSNHQLKLEIEKRKTMENTATEMLMELKEMQSQLIQSAKLASIGELASGVAHELNQPLMVIRANVQLMMRTVDKGSALSSVRDQPLGLVEANTKRMMNIINHLRTFSRQSKEKFGPVDVNNIIEGSLLMVGEQLRLRNIDLKLELMEDLPKISGNVNQLEQVVLNLLTNARDVIEAFGTKNKRIRVIKVSTGTSGKNREWVEVLVRDTGQGINNKDLKRIFEPFFTTKEVGDGTGLGLSISYGIVKDHHGMIDVAETGAGGTTFRVRLPVLKSSKNTDKKDIR
jgi:signal transduction histidine kinase